VVYTGVYDDIYEASVLVPPVTVTLTRVTAAATSKALTKALATTSPTVTLTLTRTAATELAKALTKALAP
jgi:hypothetical protein